jgi:predicted dehydrogenase
VRLRLQSSNCLRTLLLSVAVAAWFAGGASRALSAEPRRVGIIGCDTSHVIAFTDLINAPDADGPLADFEVTAAYPGGSDDLTGNRELVEGYVAKLKERNIKIVESIEMLRENVDAILLESVDGRPHLAQFRAVACGKPVFVDKPMAASLSDALAIFAIAEQTKTPCFSASALRFCDQVTDLANDQSLGRLLGCETAGPYKLEPHHPDWFWYGIHSVESLATILGRGCKSASSVETDTAGVIVATWSDGRLGTVRGIKQGKADYFFTAYGERGVGRRQGFGGYAPLVTKICRFFSTGEPPVSREETIEVLALMEAAEESQRRDGAPVLLSEIIQTAERAADARAKLGQ